MRVCVYACVRMHPDNFVTRESVASASVVPKPSCAPACAWCVCALHDMPPQICQTAQDPVAISATSVLESACCLPGHGGGGGGCTISGPACMDESSRSHEADCRRYSAPA